ncbi:MAG: carboxypeptidase-like regulatory domain-containing protein [Caldilineaceae bacterium]
MQIQLFPRPSADTGIGLHWCAGQSQLPITQVRSFWIPELRALGAAWIKINDHRGCLPLVEELLAAGIQPVVRIYRAAANPGTLGDEELAAVDGLVRAGVRYLEISHRPDLPSQWRNGVLPPDAPAVVARHLAQDMAAVLERGGLPALPAVDPTSRWDLISELIRLGKRDVLQGPIWQAVHNPGYNRPLHYPADPVGSEGAPLTQSLYLSLAEEEWEGNAWQERALSTVNRLRRRAYLAEEAGDNNGTGGTGRATAFPKDGGFFHFLRLHNHHRELLGRAIPILSTSGGYVLGAADDPRYPAITPSLHLAYTLEACRIVMGSSTRAAPAPDYFFCTAFWLLANQALASSRPARENDAWYSPEHPGGVLPIVPVLQAEPKRLRHTPQIAVAESLGPARQSNKDLIHFVPQAGAGGGIIAGKVQGGASVDLCLVNRESGLLLHTVARANGDFRFVDLTPGRYSVWVENPPGNRQIDIALAGDETVAVDLAVQGWGYEISEAGDGLGGMLQCSVALTVDMAAAPSLRLRWVGGERVLAMVRSGKDRIARCSAGPLEAGTYDVELLGLPDTQPGETRATVPVSRASETHVHFVHSRVRRQQEASHASIIEGRILNGDGTQVTLQNAGGRRRSVTTDPKGRFRFSGLAPGSYDIAITGSPVAGNAQTLSRSRLGVDGESALSLEFELAASGPVAPAVLGLSALVGHAPGQAGRAAIVSNGAGFSSTRRIDGADNFRFDRLPAGRYELVAGALLAVGLDVGANETAEVTFPAAASQWQVLIRRRATLRRPGMVRVQVMGRSDVPVTLAGTGIQAQVRLTGSAMEYGPFAVEFGPLETGDYTVSVPGVDVQATFRLEDTDGVAIVFQRRGALTSSPRLERLPRQ